MTNMTERSRPQPGELLRMRSDALGLESIPPTQRMDDIISNPDARNVIQNMEPLDLYHLIRAVGESDAVELATLASVHQIQTFFDLDCWQRDRFNSDRMAQWMEILIAQNDEDFKQTMRDLDPELPALLFKDHLMVFMLDFEEKTPPPELVELGVSYEHSMDNVYAIVFPEDETLNALLHQMLNRLYELDITLARVLLEATRWELKAPMEETAYRTRRARLEELGFVDLYESLVIFSWRDPDTYKKTVPSRLKPEEPEDERDQRTYTPAPSGWHLPEVFQSPDPEQSFFTQAMTRFTELAADNKTQTNVPALMYSVVLLTNKAMSALSVEPGDLDAARRTFQRVRGTLSIALEFLADRSIDTAAKLLDVAHTQELFQIGFSLTLKLARQAKQLLQNRWLDPHLTLTDTIPYGLLNDGERLVLKSLLLQRPEFGDPKASYSTPFASLLQIEQTAARMSLIAFKIMAVYGLLGLNRDILAKVAYSDGVLPGVESIRLSTILATTIARAALGQPGSAVPLNVQELAVLIEEHLAPIAALLRPIETPRSVPDLAVLDETPLFTAAMSLLSRSGQLAADALPLARTTTRRLIEEMSDELAAIPPSGLRSGATEPQFLGAAILLSVTTPPK